MALNVVQVEEIAAVLREVPRLVDGLESRSSGFLEGVHKWLKKAESVLESNRLPAVSQVASCRAQLYQAIRGQQISGISFSGRPTPRKIADATAAMVLQRCDQILHDAIAERMTVNQEAERIARQLVAVAEAKGMLAQCAGEPGAGGVVSCLQQKLKSDPDLAGLYTHLAALVGKNDVPVFLDRALPGS